MDLNLLLEEIITESFPELMDEDIQLEWKKLDDALMEVGGFKSDGFFIEIDKSLKKADKEVLIGGLAHELCHVVAEKEMSKKQSFVDSFARWISKRYLTLDERNTDLQTIIRGYGKELLQFLKFSEKEGFEHYKEDGLSIRELKKILKAG